MNHLELLLYWSTAVFQIILCILVFARKLYQRLFFFTIYATVLAAGTLGIQLIYHHFGFHSTQSHSAYWILTMVDVVAASLAVAELCRYKLRGFKGIWGLAWRGLTLLALFFLVNALVDAWGQPNKIAIYGLTIGRDFGISSVAILLALLLIRNYYGLSLEPLQRAIATGMCLFCIVDTASNTLLKDLFSNYISSSPEHASQIAHAGDLWNIIQSSAFIVSMGIWSFALRKPLPVAEQDPVLLPAEVYDEVSGSVNLQLRAFNERLLGLLRP
jgi:hypothetical protein